MEDAHIIELYLSRSEHAISETAVKYGNYCHSIAYNILVDTEDAKEAVNDTYLGAWNSIPPNHPSILSTYLGKITRRISLNKRRDKNCGKRGSGEVALALSELEECIPSGFSVEKELEKAILAKEINSFIQTLRTSEKRVFLCRYWYLESIPDISSQLGFSESKIKSMLFRTRNKFRDHLEKGGVFYDK